MPQHKELAQWVEDELRAIKDAQALLRDYDSALKYSAERWQALADDLPTLEQATAEELSSYLGKQSGSEAYLSHLKQLLDILLKNAERQVYLRKQLLTQAKRR
jgi:hypothetical protein